MRALAALTLLLMAATPVAAQQTTRFDGVYAGAYAGTSILGDNGVPSGGAIVGGRLYATDGLVLGVEARAGLGNNNGRASLAETFVDGQVGVQIDNTLIFATAGVGRTFTQSIIAQSPPTGPNPVNTTDLITLGGGVEFAPNQTVRLRGEVHEAIESLSTFPATRLSGALLFSLR